ncbi:MAG: cytochrome P460 family protein [Candidatus Poribacteria bacterium]|nr:cytochrome P460 family protein [Candidatus Poribacteria bacterium]
MLNRQSVLIAILIGCVVFVACGDSEDDEPEMDDEAEQMLAAGLPSDIAGYESWRSVDLGAPPAEFEAPQNSGSAHGAGTRTVYINSTGVETLENASEQTFHSGTTIVKDIMDDANSYLWRVAVMWKVDDAMYADHNNWRYIQYQRDSADDVFIGVAGDIDGNRGEGCHACHSKVNDEAVPGKDSVFTQLP